MATSDNPLTLESFDSWLSPGGPVAIVLREPLESVEGPDGVVFPPTFAPPKGEVPNYVIDDTSAGKVALMDTVGAQANRIEPIFKEAPYAGLVPRASVTIGTREVNLLDAGHRAADALVRFSSVRATLSDAFRSLADTGDASKLAKLAPTSLVFGVWDSRDTGVKLPRLVSSTVRAFQVEPLTRSAQFFSAFEKDETESLGFAQDFLSEQGLSDAPAGKSVGGVLARGGIRRQTVLNLIALRALAAGSESPIALQRYILGLSLVALTAPARLFLRQGCLLVASGPASQQVVSRDGTRSPFELTPHAALGYAQLAASAFGVGDSWTAQFQPEAVGVAVEGAKAKRDKSKASKGKS